MNTTTKRINVNHVNAARVGAYSAIDLIVRRHTAFSSFNDMVYHGVTHAYIPTLHCKVDKHTTFDLITLQDAAERTVLADAFDAAMVDAMVDRKTFRTHA